MTRFKTALDHLLESRTENEDTFCRMAMYDTVTKKMVDKSQVVYATEWNGMELDRAEISTKPRLNWVHALVW
jgi:hypothetical protein